MNFNPLEDEDGGSGSAGLLVGDTDGYNNIEDDDDNDSNTNSSSNNNNNDNNKNYNNDDS